MPKNLKLVERLLARGGKSLEDLPSNTSVGKLIRRHGVRPESEFYRIKALPRRHWEDDPQTAEWVKLFTEAYKTPTGTMTLLPVQATVLKELHDLRGCMGVARVGSGKTLISALAPVVLEAKRPLYLGPAKLMDKTHKEFRALADHWQVSRDYEYLSYEKLGNLKYYADVLERLRPDFICAEEAHHIKNPKAIRTKVLKAYLKKYPDTIFLVLTGTRARNSIKNGAHLAEWSLGEMTPFPRNYHVLEEWASALDETVKGERLAVGCLTEFSDKPNPSLSDVQAAIGKRLKDTPGFVTVQSSDCDSTLVFEGEPFNDYPPQVEEYFRALRQNSEAPNGETFTAPIQLREYLLECQTEFFYYLDPPPPEPWREAKRAWGSLCRDILTHNNQNWMAEWQVALACSRGEVDSGGIYERWKAIKPIYDQDKHKRTAWFGDSAVNFCAKWLDKEEGVLFTPYVAVGEKLAEITGMPYFGRGGESKQHGHIDDYRKPCIASLSANMEGRNLQHYSKAMLLGGVGSSTIMEQLLGRLHRRGQAADEVSWTLFFGCIEALTGVWQAKREAVWGVGMNADEAHKMIVADILLPTVEEAEEWKSVRWQRKL